MGQQNKALAQSPNTVILDIPTRLQWQNAHGYCGQTCIQTCSLYYGNYISQVVARKIAQGQVLVGQNAGPTIQKLGYLIEQWDNNKPKPQYKQYLQWIKKHIKAGHPVIITGYTPEGDNDQYDHIYLAVGFNSQNIDQYSDEDQLIYMDNYEVQYTVTKFGKIWGTKGMKNNDKDLSFAIPKNVNYGIAMLGIDDPQEQFLPVRINLQQKSQPNVSLGKQSKTFKYTVVVSQLEKGKRYALLRYDSYKVLPKKNVVENQATSVKKFQAQSDTFQMQDKVESSSCVFYRCVQEENLG